VPRGSEAKRGEPILSPGMRWAMPSSRWPPKSARRNCAAPASARGILSTGDEVVSIDQEPGAFQIRNSNSVSLAAQCGSRARTFLRGNAADSTDDFATKYRALARGRWFSPAASQWEVRLVETVLKIWARSFTSTRSLFAREDGGLRKCGNTFVFGLPGNPVSTMVTFELFVVPTLTC